MHMLAKRLFSLASQTFRSLSPAAFRAPRKIFLFALAGGAAGLGGCAQQPALQRVAAGHSKEYFPSSKYGPASPRVVADGEPVPRGGGIYMVGKPYTVAGHTYYPSEKRYAAVGLASWYGDAFHGRRTSNGEIYDRDALSAAHPTMPLPSYARVTNLYNHRSIIVRVNDRGPFAADRIMDVSRRTAQALEFHAVGTARVKVEYVGAASLNGSDDDKLMATLRLDGPATLDRQTPEMAAASPSTPPLAFAAMTPLQTPAPQPEESAASPRQRGHGAATEKTAEAAPVSHAMRQFAGGAPLPPARPSNLSDASSGRLRVAMRQKQAE
jgi:rare lipoprotein A